MKIKNINIFLCFLVIDFFIALPQVSAWFNPIRPGNFQFDRVLRLCFILYLIIPLFQQAISGKFLKVGEKYWIQLIFPPIVYLFVLAAQILFLKNVNLSTHFNSSVDFVFRNILFICLALNMSSDTGKKITKLIPIVFLITFILLIVQYPPNILSSGRGIGQVISALAQGSKFKSFGLFRAANEDANALMTLLPFAFLFVENMSQRKRFFIRIFLLIIVPIVLLFNGTRTAMVITFPLILILFYSDLSLKKVLKLSPLLIPFGSLMFFLLSEFISSMFATDTSGDGSFGWRREIVWEPAIAYINQTSPLIGYGARGWEVVARAADIGNWRDGSFVPIATHNLYVWLYACAGLIGLSVFMFFVICIILSSLKLSNSQDKEISALSKACFCSTIAYVIWGSISNAYMPAGFSIIYSLGILVSALRVINLRKHYEICEKNPYLNFANRFSNG